MSCKRKEKKKKVTEQKVLKKKIQSWWSELQKRDRNN